MFFKIIEKDILTLPSWIDSSELSGGNTEEDVIRRGFRFTPPEKGTTFSTGCIKDCDDRMPSSTRKVLLCKLGVGRAFAVDTSKSLPECLPQGYDSFYLHNGIVDDQAGPEKYRHD